MFGGADDRIIPRSLRLGRSTDALAVVALAALLILFLLLLLSVRWIC
jgi:hypothetical protein